MRISRQVQSWLQTYGNAALLLLTSIQVHGGRPSWTSPIGASSPYRTGYIGIDGRLAGIMATDERILFYTGRRTASAKSMKARHHGLDGAGAEARHYHTSAATTCTWRDMRINIMILRATSTFTAEEVERSLRVLDGAVAVFDAVHGVQPQSEKVWRQADKYGVPRICFINKIDRWVRISSTPSTLSQAPQRQACGDSDPIGQEAKFVGVVDLVDMKLCLERRTMGAEYVHMKRFLPS